MGKKEENLLSLSLHEASNISGLHQDYLRFLCRTGKLAGQKIGRNWTTTKVALNEYLTATNSEDNKTSLSLHEASNISGLHQDYLRFLCRTGKLAGQKIGRNWTTTKYALWEFRKNYKNGLSEVVDETGKKILVLAESPSHTAPVSAFSQGLTLRPDDVSVNFVTPAFGGDVGVSALRASPPVPASLTMPQNNDVSPAQQVYGVNQQDAKQILSLNNLREKVFENIENRIQNLSDSLALIENRVELKSPEESGKLAAEQKKPLIFADQPQPLLSKRKFKKFYQSIFESSLGNLPLVFACGLIALLGLLGSFLWADFAMQKQLEEKPNETIIIRQNNKNQAINVPNSVVNNLVPSSGQGLAGNNFVGNNNVVINRTVNELLGFSSSDIYNLIDNRLSQYLAEGKFRGQTGPQGPQGPAGAAASAIGGPAAPVTYVFGGSSSNNTTGSVGAFTDLSATNFSAETANINNLNVQGSSVFNGSATFNSNVNLNGTTTAANLIASNLNLGFSPGSVVFQGANGLAQDNANLFYTASTSQLSLGTTTPNASALLELDSTNKGFLAPRLTQAQRDAIANPAAGLLVFNTDSNEYEVYNGTSWAALGSGGGNGSVATGTPNSFAYYSSSNQLSSQNSLFINGGNIGIGTSTPTSPLTIVGNALLSGNETLIGQLSVSATSTLATTTITQLTLGQPLAISSGGTGTSTAPTANQILIGNGARGLQPGGDLDFRYRLRHPELKRPERL